LERALEQAVTSPEMGAAALELARTEHSLDRVADLYAEALSIGTGSSLSLDAA
jgi:hypothetical protein